MKIVSWGATIDAENNYWIPVLGTDVLVKGKENGVYEYVGKIDFEKYGIKDKCILKVLEMEEKILLFARNSYDVWVVDKHVNEIVHIKYYKASNSDIADIVQCGENVIVFPYTASSPIINCNIKTFNTNVVKYDYLSNDTFAFVRGVAEGNFVYSATRTLNAVYINKVDVANNIASFFKTSLKMINAIEVNDDDIWLFGLSSKDETVIQKYNNKYEMTKEFVLNNILPVLENGYMNYFKMCLYKHKLFLIPSSNEKVYVYDTEVDKGYFLDYPSSVINNKINDLVSFVEVQRDINGIYLFPYGFDTILKLSFEEEKFDVITMSLQDEIEKIINKSVIESSNILAEGNPMYLDEFIKAL